LPRAPGRGDRLESRSVSGSSSAHGVTNLAPPIIWQPLAVAPQGSNGWVYLFYPRPMTRNSSSSSPHPRQRRPSFALERSSTGAIPSLYLPRMLRLLASLLVVILAVSCKSRPLGPYVSPRVTGQVFAADNQHPLAGVRVTRGSAEKRRRPASSPKGGELLMQKVPIRTDANGRFILPSERVLSVFRGSGWNIVSLSFDVAGYSHFQTNCPGELATTPASGELELDLGAIYLQPAPR